LSECRSEQRAGHSTGSEARDEGADNPDSEHPEVHQVGRVAISPDNANAEAESDQDEGCRDRDTSGKSIHRVVHGSSLICGNVIQQYPFVPSGLFSFLGKNNVKLKTLVIRAF
jgi:hypothetical protein